MSEAAHGREPSLGIERLLEAVLVPVEPPAGFVDELEVKLADVQAAAREALGEMSDWELATMRDPRNWVRPAAAVPATSAAAGRIQLRGSRIAASSQSVISSSASIAAACTSDSLCSSSSTRLAGGSTGASAVSSSRSMRSRGSNFRTGSVMIPAPPARWPRGPLRAA